MKQTIPEKVRWTTSDVDLLPQDEWKRYEIIDGELFVTRAPHIYHQNAIGKLYFELERWSRTTEMGKAILTPGIIFSEADNVQPDLVWISHKRLAMLVDEAGHLTGAPELIIEVLSPGTTNERRDKEAKLKLYSSQGVQAYWIVNWRLKIIEVYQRENAQLTLVATLLEQDTLTSLLLPNFSCPVSQLFT